MFRIVPRERRRARTMPRRSPFISVPGALSIATFRSRAHCDTHLSPGRVEVDPHRFSPRSDCDDRRFGSLPPPMQGARSLRSHLRESWQARSYPRCQAGARDASANRRWPIVPSPLRVVHPTSERQRSEKAVDRSPRSRPHRAGTGAVRYDPKRTDDRTNGFGAVRRRPLVTQAGSFDRKFRAAR